MQNAKAGIEDFKMQAEQAERNGDYGQVAEIRYGKIKAEEKKIADLTEQINSSSEKRLLKEEVDAEDIAASVAKATGILVHKMIQSEREKLLKLEEHLHQRVLLPFLMLSEEVEQGCRILRSLLARLYSWALRVLVKQS